MTDHRRPVRRKKEHAHIHYHKVANHSSKMLIKHEQSGSPATLNIINIFKKRSVWNSRQTPFIPLFCGTFRTPHQNYTKTTSGASLSKHSSNDIVGAPRSTAAPTSGASQVDSQRPRQRRFWALRTPQRASNLVMANSGNPCRYSMMCTPKVIIYTSI